jgi:iron complex outermembrane recepter protein
MRRHFKRTALSAAALQAVLMSGGLALAQDAPAPAVAASAASAPAGAKKEASQLEAVTITGQRRALESAQSIKKNADEVVDSIVADDIGKLPDKSVTEVLQRLPGITIDRTMAADKNKAGDAIEHFSAEGSTVAIRGLSYVRSELNGRDSFSANGGRALSFEDVPPELMSGLDVYKNPSAEHIEGAIGGLVNLRTALPFDFKGAKGAFSLEVAHAQLAEKTLPSFSGLLSNRWNTDLGEFGALIHYAHSKVATRTDGYQVSPYYPRTDPFAPEGFMLSNPAALADLKWVPTGASWRTLNFERERQGLYGAAQWRKDNLSSALTYFQSKYQMHWDENAVFTTVGAPFDLTVDPGAEFDSRGVLVRGTLRAPNELDNGAPFGIPFGTNARDSNRVSDTRDLSWSLNWRVSDQWTLRSELQAVRAKTRGLDSHVAIGTGMLKQQVDLSTFPPGMSFDAADRARLADPASYFWDSEQQAIDKGSARQNAWRGDATFSFDHAVLRELRFGLRITDRQAVTNQANQWQAISASWTAGGRAHLRDFPGPTRVNEFPNFFGGKVPAPPAVVFPDMSLPSGFPGTTQQLHDIGRANCIAQRTAQNQSTAECDGWPFAWTAPTLSDDPSNASRNTQKENTHAIYGQLQFGFDDLRYPVDGNIGLRVVQTKSSAEGYAKFDAKPLTDLQRAAGLPEFDPLAEAQSFKKSYTNALPSMNLRMKVSEQLQFRFAFAKAISRPDFGQLQAYTTYDQANDDNPMRTRLSGTAKGNPLLKPVRANSMDLTAEYYPSRSTSFTAAFFNKQLEDIVIGQTTHRQIVDKNGQAHDFLVTSPVNGAKGHARGIEFGMQTYFDKLPGWLSGFGVQANYTYIDSKQSLYEPVDGAWCTPNGLNSQLMRDLNGCDVHGRAFGGNLPLTGLSKNAYNLALLYDHGPISARLAYTWRSRYLQAVSAYGTNGNNGRDYNPNSPTYGQAWAVNFALPTWGDSYGQLDMGLQYKVNDALTVAFEGQNLNNAIYKQYMQQSIGMMQRESFSTGRRYVLQMRYAY